MKSGFVSRRILELLKFTLYPRLDRAGFESREEAKAAIQALRGVTINLLAEWEASFVPGQIPILLEMRVKPGGQNHRYITFLLFLKEVGVNNLFYTVDSSDPVMKLLKRAKKQGIILETIDYSKGTGMWHIIKDPMEILKAKVNRLSPAERRLLGG